LFYAVDFLKDYISRMAVDCTNCQYCMPCPVGVDIPGCFSFLNTGSMFEDMKYMLRGSTISSFKETKELQVVLNAVSVRLNAHSI
jgi:predicted aldo/keto reductase-like oxidoreductase